MRKLTISLAVMAALLPGRGYPLGLGEIELNSALNQELNAHVEILSAAPEDTQQLIVNLADREAFVRAGIDRPFLLQQLKFKIITKDSKPYIQVYTQKPVREPFLSFLVEIDWPQGHLLREYTLLLDPPVFSGASTAQQKPASMDSRPFIDPADQQVQQVQSDAGSPWAQQDARPAQSSYQAAAPTQAAPVVIESDDRQGQVTYRPMQQYSQVSGSYRVKQDDTLWSLANRMRPDASVSVEQMMLALVRENPESFIEQNIHGVKRGYILRMPDRAAITAVDRQTALAQVKDHTSLWREYRQAQTGATPASAMEAEDSAAAATDMAEHQAGEGQLSIVSASGDEGSETAASGQDPEAELSRLKQQLSLAQESLESERLEKEELRARLADLEQRVQNVLQMDDGELAKLQQDLAGVEPEMPVAEEPVVAEEVPAEQPVDELVTDETSPMEDMAAEESVMETTELAAEADSMVEAPGEESVFVDEAAEPMATDEGMVAEEPMPVVEDQIIVPEFARPRPKTFIESLLEDPKMLAAIGGGIAAIFVLIGLLLRKRRKSAAAEEEDWTADDDMSASLEDVAEEADQATVKIQTEDDMGATAEMEAEGFDDTQIEAPDEEESLEDTVFNLDGAEEAEAPAEDERDDVIAEADVYLAYGIYQQAEELLGDAIKQNPERDDYRMKLLETHFAAKNADAYATLAEEVQGRKANDKAYWDRVVVMGRELCPDNTMFSSSDVEALADFDTDELLPQKPETTDLELDAGEAEVDLGDLDLGFDEEPVADDADATMVLSEPVDLDAGTEDALALDDDLDLAGELEDITDEIEAPAEEAEADSDLEFDLGDFEAELEEADGSAAEVETDESSELDIDEDFSLDFEAADLGFEDETETTDESAGEASEAVADIDETEDLTAELDLDEDLDLAITEDVPELDTATTEESAELDMDMDELGAELDLVDEAEPAEEISALAGDEDDDFDISELSDDVDEVSTKLDLAKAYIDMGDNEGARSILEEVKQEGNDAQQQQADELLERAS
ncbi:MAG: hypothetical protein OQL06_09610 [Gammaproteobacteria bacterium]|nr:hypothetical protein [Gammaproteobacteria bacterium]